MCKLWKKVYLCNCASHMFRDRCTFAIQNDDHCDGLTLEDVPRKSHFKCYDCLKAEVEAEKADTARTAQDAAAAEEEKKTDAERARQLQIRKEAEARAQREREEDLRRERDRKAEIERQRREGGAWQDAGSLRKGKGWKGSGPPGRGPVPSASMPPSPLKIVTGCNGGLGAPSNASPTKTASVAPASRDGVGADPGGRAGKWGPKSPPKILMPENPPWKKVPAT